MALFRKHRGSLADSLKTTVIVKNMHHLRDAIYEDWAMWEGALRKKDDKPFSKDCFNIKIEPYYGDIDERCGWYTQIVSADLEVKDEFMAIGYLSEPLSPIVLYFKNEIILSLNEQPPKEDGSQTVLIEQRNGDFFPFSKGAAIEIPLGETK